jgi:hypothetical protein
MKASLIKASEKDQKAIKLMAQNLNLLASVTIKNKLSQNKYN